jgi:hypothetical protein
MAEPVSVGVQRGSSGQPTAMIVTISDTLNNSMQLVGIPGLQYNLASLVNPSNATTTAVEVNFDPAEQAIAGLFNTSMQSQLPSLTLTPDQVISFTDNLGNTLSILGSINTAYDLNVLNYLLAVVNAIDTFMTLQYGDSYDQVKHDKLNLLNLE